MKKYLLIVLLISLSFIINVYAEQEFIFHPFRVEMDGSKEFHIKMADGINKEFGYDSQR